MAASATKLANYALKAFQAGLSNDDLYAEIKSQKYNIMIDDKVHALSSAEVSTLIKAWWTAKNKAGVDSSSFARR